MIANFTAAEVVQIIAAVGALVGTIATASVLIIAAIKKVERKTDDIAKKVNGAASDSKAEIKNLRDEVRALKDDRADKKQIAAVLAQSTSQTLPPPPVPPPPQTQLLP